MIKWIVKKMAEICKTKPVKIGGSTRITLPAKWVKNAGVRTGKDITELTVIAVTGAVLILGPKSIVRRVELEEMFTDLKVLAELETRKQSALL